MTKTLMSLGMSCQTVHQLARFVQENPLSAHFRKGPFDWLICPPTAAISWLATSLEGFNPADLSIQREHVWWQKHGFWFWHGFYTKSDETKLIEIAANSARELSKLAYQRAAFMRLDPANTIFILSNTQNNLVGDVFAPSEQQHCTVNYAGFLALKSALEHYFNSAVEIHLLTRPGRSGDAATQNSMVHFLHDESSQWKGSDADWDTILYSILYGN